MLKTNKTNVGANASVCPNAIKEYNNRRGTGHRAQESNAITLIALVITIIILIILVGVTLNLTLGENGIFNKSKQGVDKYEETSVAEALSLAIVDADLTNYAENENEGYFNYLKAEGYIKEIETTALVNNKDVKISSRAEEREGTEDKGPKGQVDTKKTIGKETKRKYYLYENGELYVEMQDTKGEKLIVDLWNENGVNNNDEEETTIAELVKKGQIHVGDYVDYEKLIGEERTYETWDCDGFCKEIGKKTLETEDLKWKVLSINKETGGITLISEKPTYATFEIPKDKTEEEIINKLNEACNKLYGVNGVECRNLDYNDIKDIINTEYEEVVFGGEGEDYYYEGNDKKYEGIYPMLITDNLGCIDETLTSLTETNTIIYDKIYGVWLGGLDGGRVLSDFHEWGGVWGTKFHVPLILGKGKAWRKYLPMRPVVELNGGTRALTKDYIIEKMCEDVSSLYWRGTSKLYDPNKNKYYEKDEDGQWYYINWEEKQVPLTEQELNEKISDLYDIENKKFKYKNMYYQNDEGGWYWFSRSDNEKMYAGTGIEGIRNILENFMENELTLLVN